MSESSNVKAARLRGDKESPEYIAFRDANNAAAARYRERNPGRVEAASRNYHYETAFGITRYDYELQLARQGGTCAICKNAETALGRGGKPKPLAVDHCHATNVVRGLLCHSCNQILGFAKDNTVTLRAAALYLEVAKTNFTGKPTVSAADLLDEIMSL